MTLGALLLALFTGYGTLGVALFAGEEVWSALGMGWLAGMATFLAVSLLLLYRRRHEPCRGKMATPETQSRVESRPHREVEAAH